MIINLVILLVILLLLCNSISYNTTYKCPSFPLKIRYVRASRLPGQTFTQRVGIDTINLKLDRDVPCGIYSVTNIYGQGALMVTHTDPRTGYLSMKDMQLVENAKLVDLWDLQRLDAMDNKFIQTYNRGCCV